jgi:hypothetical protein
MENQTEKISPKHVFLHLFVIIMLYAATINFLTLAFQYINVWVPDTLSEISFYAQNQYHNIIRFALSAFIIIFPVFILTSWFLNRSYLKNPAVKDMKTRKWLIYFTLFVAALIIIGDLVGIVFTFLEGEITTRFILKALSVLFVTIIIFGYYLWDVRRKKAFKNHKKFVWTIIIIALITIIAGFFIIGSPKTERLERLDLERTENLSDIQWQIINYWQKKERLPEQLSDLEDDISGYTVPDDPITGESYEYQVKGEETFELCASFDLDSQEQTIARPKEEQNWQHGPGRTCFERTIDKELYYRQDKTSPAPLIPAR